MLPSVSSEKTTPQPNVSFGRLRSSTVTRADGSRRFMRMPKKSPAGPPPTLTMFILDS
jgi:hypothetical protein